MSLERFVALYLFKNAVLSFNISYLFPLFPESNASLR